MLSGVDIDFIKDILEVAHGSKRVIIYVGGNTIRNGEGTFERSEVLLKKDAYIWVESEQSKNAQCYKRKGESVGCQFLQRSVVRERLLRRVKTLQRLPHSLGRERADFQGGGANAEIPYSW